MSGTPATRILLAHKQTILREGLTAVLSQQPDLRVVAGADNGRQALRLAIQTKPDVMVLDTSIDVHSVMHSFRRQKLDVDGCRVLVLENAQETASVNQAFRLGVRGVVSGKADAAVLINAIRSIRDERYWNLDHEVSRLEIAIEKLANSVSIPLTKKVPSKTFGLTPREFEIVSAVVSGYSNRQIGENMSISLSTTKHHLTSIFEKLGVYNRLELVLFAIHHGLVERGDHLI